MNYSTASNYSNNATVKTNEYFYPGISYSQFVGIILAGSALLVSISVLLFLIICQKYRHRINKLNNIGLTSNNPCYVGSSMSQFDGGSNHAHCNMTVSRDFYDIDDLTSLDNDSFLNSLENAIFVGYLNHNRTSYKVDDRFSQSTVHSNPPIHNTKVQVAQTSNPNSSRHSYKKSAPTRYSAAHSSVKLRNGKLKASTSKPNNVHDSTRIRAKSETISESIGSTSNLITSSKMFLDDSNDSVCDSGKDSNQLAETLAIESRDSNPDTKTESSTDSHTSVNSSCAMISGYSADVSTPGQALPDIINSSLPRSSKAPRKASSTYSNSLNRDDTVISSTGQILDPLRAGQDIQFVNDIVQSTINQNTHTHERRVSYNRSLFDYQISS